MKLTPRIKYFRQEGSLSFILFDPQSHDAICIDPDWMELESYREYIHDHRLKLRAAIDTHTHADHYSCSHVLKSEFGAEILMSQTTKSGRVTRKVSDGDSFAFGSFSAKFLLTPGHTPDSLCVQVGNLLFTGDLLFIGSTGRTDFPGSDPKQSFASLQRVLKLSPETIVFPGHDYQMRLFSTLGVEREKNPDIKLSEDQYVRLKKEELMMTAPLTELNSVIQFNLQANPANAPDIGGANSPTQCGVVPKDLPAIAAIAVEKYATKLKEASSTTAFIDVREPDEWDEGHMPGARLIPMAELPFYLDELKKFSRIYFSCRSGMRSGICTRTFEHLGFKDVVNVAGGFKAWESGGFPVTKPKS